MRVVEARAAGCQCLAEPVQHLQVPRLHQHNASTLCNHRAALAHPRWSCAVSCACAACFALHSSSQRLGGALVAEAGLRAVQEHQVMLNASAWQAAAWADEERPVTMRFHAGCTCLNKRVVHFAAPVEGAQSKHFRLVWCCLAMALCKRDHCLSRCFLQAARRICLKQI